MVQRPAPFESVGVSFVRRQALHAICLTRRGARLCGCVLGAGALLSQPAQAQLDLSGGQRAADGTMYQVIAVRETPLLSGADFMRITTVAGSVNGLTACSNSGSGPGQTTSAIGGANVLVPQVLHAFSATTRSGILSADLGAVAFNPANGGRLTIGSGAGAISVCRNTADCSGAVNVVPIYSLGQNAGGVPSACIASALQTPCSATAPLESFGFGLPATGNPPVCDQLPTTSTRICDPVPEDGFTLQSGEFVVFIYQGNLAMSGFTNAAGAFGIDADDGEICGPNQVVTADAQAPSAPPYLVAVSPTPSATTTPTRTATATATEAMSAGEICIDGVDNDGDGMVDCGDTDCACQQIARDPAHLCPNFRGHYRYTIHARVYPSVPITTIASQGITIALQHHGQPPWFRFQIPARNLQKRPVGKRGTIYSFRDRSSGEGLKYFSVRETWVHGRLQYWINGRATVRAPLAGRVDIEQQITLGDVPFASLQRWKLKKACVFLSDWVLPPA